MRVAALLAISLSIIGPARGADAGGQAQPSDAVQLEYFRQISDMPAKDYKQLAKVLPFLDSGTARFPGVEGPGHRLSIGHHAQSADLNGIVVSRVFDFTLTEADTTLQVHNSNSYPVFVEIDYLKTARGEGVYAGLAPGETASWSWPPTFCVARAIVFKALQAQCNDYAIFPATAHVWMLR
jgi:hypothetical protein